MVVDIDVDITYGKSEAKASNDGSNVNDSMRKTARPPYRMSATSWLDENATITEQPNRKAAIAAGT